MVDQRPSRFMGDGDTLAEHQVSQFVSTKTNEGGELPPTPPAKDDVLNPILSPGGADSYFNPLGLSRTNSIYSLSRASFSSQLSQLTSLHLPQASSLSSSVLAIPTAPVAAKALSNAAEQMQRWIQKAAEVLGGLNAEDDVEWAAAGGREGLGEVDAAIQKFESLVGVYVTAIEQLHERQDISNVPTEELKGVVGQMEATLKAWNDVRQLLKGVKSQVELAMEWEELWNVVLGDIGLEMETLSELVFEMEEKRHQTVLSGPIIDSSAGLDLQELETIVEENPGGGTNKSNHRFSLPPAFPPSSPLQSPGEAPSQEDSSLLALFARMQPLRASLDFLPMRLSTFQSRAKSVLPTACQELETRRGSLEKEWRRLEKDAEGLRRELGEDRWVLVFRNAGRQAQKMCESVERSLYKLRESIDIGVQHSNPPSLAKKAEQYEAKKTHYGPAIQRILAIIEKGVKDRLTVNGEILRLQSDMQARWASLDAEMNEMDLALDDLNIGKNQQLRDSISTIVSNDRSNPGSAVETPGSSPASSVIVGPPSNKKGDHSTPIPNGTSRRSSVISTTSRTSTSRRNISMPPGSAGTTQLSRMSLMPRSVTAHTSSIPRTSSPCPSSKSSSVTPIPGGRPQRPSASPLNNKPRWNSSPKVDPHEIGHNFKPMGLSTPRHRTSLSYRSPSSASSYSSTLPPPSPLGRESSSSPTPSTGSTSRPRISSGAQSSLVFRHRTPAPPSPARYEQSADLPRVRQSTYSSATKYMAGSASRRQSMLREDMRMEDDAIGEESPSARPRMSRPATAMASGRRSSMLPQPKIAARVASGPEERREWR